MNSVEKAVPIARRGAARGRDPAAENAKAFLMKNSSATGVSLYDHLVRVLSDILTHRPTDVVDVFEGISVKVKAARFDPKTLDTLHDRAEKTARLELAELQLQLLSKDDEDDDGDSTLPNFQELGYYFEQAGVGVGREELFKIGLAIKAGIVDEHSIESVRFWGKIFGTGGNYLVAEAEYKDGEEDEEEEDEGADQAAEEEEEEEEEEADENEDDEEGEGRKMDRVPKPKFKRSPVVPREGARTGVNKKVYFVSAEAGLPWTRLPRVSPAQIVAARRIKKFFTGRLDAPIVTYPPFPGLESHYLRAQIARISAGTQISPAGYFQLDEDDPGDEDGMQDHVLLNEDFEPPPLRDLVDPGLAGWVHHVLHILPQGRTRWWNPTEAAGGADDPPEDEDEDKEEPPEAVPEVGPPLLTPLAEDADLEGGSPAWCVAPSSRLQGQYGVAVVHSCAWPGAHAFARGRIFENIYVGWGHKWSPHNPTLPPAPQSEFPAVDLPAECDDPSAEEEIALRKQNEPEPEGEEGEDDEGDEGEGGEGEGGEGGEDDENMEDEDD